MDILLPPAARELDTAAREDRRRTVGSRPRPCPALYLLELQTNIPEDYANLLTLSHLRQYEDPKPDGRLPMVSRAEISNMDAEAKL